MADETSNAVSVPENPSLCEPALEGSNTTNREKTGLDKVRPQLLVSGNLGNSLDSLGVRVLGHCSETPVAMPAGGGGDMELDHGPMFKVLNKRKKWDKGYGNKQLKDIMVDKRESDSDASDSVFNCRSQDNCLQVVYSVEKIKEFLTMTKWQKNVAVDEHFPDLKQFAHDGKLFRREGAFARWSSAA